MTLFDFFYYSFFAWSLFIAPLITLITLGLLWFIPIPATTNMRPRTRHHLTLITLVAGFTFIFANNFSGWIGLTFFCIGNLWYYYRDRNRRFNQESINWPTTEGEVLKSDIKPVRYLSGVIVNYAPQLTVKYSLKKRQFSTTRYAFFPSLDDKDLTKEKLKPYAVGNRVTVYYHPTNPSIAVLNPNLHRDDTHITPFVTFTLFIPFGLLVILFATRTYIPNLWEFIQLLT
ncbi:MAG TPA: DUF3592 domain-containing protein [Anaerolineae bacterium]|nr:DUF3592 domain-containing protein [Anaerolineae bacterium]